MGNIGKAFKRAGAAFSKSMRSEDMQLGKYEAGGKEVTCPHCGSEEFAEGNALLNTDFMTFLDLDWADKSATTLACANCGRIQWFLKHPKRV